MSAFTDQDYQFVSSEKQIRSNSSKTKNLSIWANGSRHNQAYSSAIIERLRKPTSNGHSRYNNFNGSHSLKKNRSKHDVKNKSGCEFEKMGKCDTEAYLSSKKISPFPAKSKNKSLSKKTLRKRKNTTKTEIKSKLYLSECKNEEESETLKSSGKRYWNKKENFNSACFSRNIDRDILLMEEMGPVSCDFLHNSEMGEMGQMGQMGKNKNGTQVSRENSGPKEMTKNSLKEILSHTKYVLFSYKKKCDELEQSCSFYKKEVNKLNKKLEGLELNKRKTHVEKNWSKSKKFETGRDKIRSTCPDKF